jgi:N-acetylglutamate synthase-like GNAT family acetyltransferase
LSTQQSTRPSIRACAASDVPRIEAIINDAAQAYQGVIPADVWHEPYMSREALQAELAAGVRFYGYERSQEMLGVMGIQDVQDVTLIRHAYVRTTERHQGIGGELLAHLRKLTQRPLLIGTWKAATWAIAFYVRHGFTLQREAETERLLFQYWTVPARQRMESVVLTDARWSERAGGA